MGIESFNKNSGTSNPELLDQFQGRTQKIENLVSEENPRQMGLFYYIPEQRFNKNLPEELNKNSTLEVNFNKVQEYQRQLNDLLRTFPGNQEDVVSIIQEIDQFLESSLPEITSRITNETLVELKKEAKNKQSKTIENQIDSVLDQRRNLFNKEDYSDTDPRRINITFPDKLVEIAKNRMQILKSTNERIKNLAGQGLPNEEVSRQESIESVNTIAPDTVQTNQIENTSPEKSNLSAETQEFILELEQEMEQDREEITTLNREYNKYLEQLNKISAKINLQDSDYETQVSNLRNLSQDRSLRQITNRLYPYFSKYTAKKLALERLTGNTELSNRNKAIQSELENTIDKTNTEESRVILNKIKNSYLIPTEIKNELSRIL
jgi:hypothetical protein